MGELDKDYWRELDEQCVAAETELEEQKKWIENDAQAELEEFQSYLETLTIEEQEIALEGLKWYEKHFMDDQELESGWHKDID